MRVVDGIGETDVPDLVWRVLSELYKYSPKWVL
jgi:hypothetical protein